MRMLAEGPIRLVVEEGASVAREAAAWWPAWALWAGLAAMVLMTALTIRRLALKPRDPYDRLLRRLCEGAGISADARTRLMMRAGGDAERATGLMLLRALREAELVNSEAMTSASRRSSRSLERA